eukprot:scaffold382_cov69-Cylindrotheca_fusiformis.AAC.1
MPSRTGPDEPHPNTDLVATPQSVIFRLTPVYPVMLALSVEWTRSSRMRWGYDSYRSHDTSCSWWSACWIGRCRKLRYSRTGEQSEKPIPTDAVVGTTKIRSTQSEAFTLDSSISAAFQ